jgi:hypothetical protein
VAEGAVDVSAFGKLYSAETAADALPGTTVGDALGLEHPEIRIAAQNDGAPSFDII